MNSERPHCIKQRVARSDEEPVGPSDKLSGTTIFNLSQNAIEPMDIAASLSELVERGNSRQARASGGVDPIAITPVPSKAKKRSAKSRVHPAAGP